MYLTFFSFSVLVVVLIRLYSFDHFLILFVIIPDPKDVENLHIHFTRLSLPKSRYILFENGDGGTIQNKCEENGEL